MVGVNNNTTITIPKPFIYALALALLSSTVFSNEANVGDFGSNQQAETIDNSSETKVTQDGVPVNTAVAPSNPAYSQDVCVFSGGAGVQTQVLGLAFGQSFTDETCQRLKLSKQLQSLGLKVGAVSVLCQDNRVWWALHDSGTPCPTTRGLIGEKAYKYYEDHPDIVPVRPAISSSKSNSTRANSFHKSKHRR